VTAYHDETSRDQETVSMRKITGIVTPEFLKTMSETQQWFERNVGKPEIEAYRYYMHEKTDTLQSDEEK
jgi:hypothetical protein